LSTPPSSCDRSPEPRDPPESSLALDGAARLHGAVVRTITLDALVPELEPAMTTARQTMGDAAFTAARDAGAKLT
jgi:hypothetical protein